MPIYDYECQRCGTLSEHYAGMGDKQCACRCGGTMKRLITGRHYINPDVEFVTDNLTGEPVRVTSRRQLNELLREHGLMEKYGKGWT